jgi:FAD/FMN-containing dehydrogenase
MTPTRATRVLADDGAINSLRGKLQGTVVAPGDDDYEAARQVWNGMVDRRPAAIVRAAGVADVLAALQFARERDLLIAVRGGGHNVAGNGTVDDGIVIDLGPMNGIRVDPTSGRVQVGPGVTLGELDRELEPFGLVVPAGVVSGTGIAGLTLGGGLGWLTRKYGLSIDSLISADVVTASGQLIHASEESEGELFWGIRGGGGNFGIVTSFEFRAYPLGPTVLAGAVFYRQRHWASALRFFDDWASRLPDELTTLITFTTPPPAWVPDELRRQPLMIVAFAWAGVDMVDAEPVLAQLRAFGPPDFEIVEPTRWVDWQASNDEIFPRGVRAYWKNASFDRLDEATIETIIDGASRLPSGRTGVDIHHMEGAFARVPENATAFPNRTARYWLNFVGAWDDPADDETGKTWAREFHSQMRPHQAVGEYVNFLGADERSGDPREQALAAYGPEKLTRLVALKNRFDPDNIFRLNHNIPPTPGSERG